MSVGIHSSKLRLDVSRYELSRNGQAVKLERQPMELLVFLIERKDELVTRNDIVEKLWGKKTFVDADGSINAAIRKIRAALKDDPAQPKFLQTIVGKGYRFIGDVDVAPPPVRLEREVTSQVPRSRVLRLFAIALAAAITMAAVLYVSQRTRSRERLPAQMSGAPIRSIAVFPLENLSHQPEQDYLADGITEELITVVSKISSLRVISRTSIMRLKGTHEPLAQIARELNVDAVIVGSVLRSGNRLRITAQLIDSHSEKYLWAEAYDRDLRDVLVLQSEVARAIAEQIKAKINPADAAKLAAARYVHPEAYQLYLQGLYQLEKGSEQSARQSQRYFQQAIAKDSNYTRAWSGLARAYNRTEEYARAKGSAKQAIALDENLAEGHSALAFATWNNDQDWATAEQELKRAIELDPNNSSPHHGYGVFLSALGRHDEAIGEMRRSIEFDPLAPLANTNLGSIYWSSHQFERAIEQLNRALEIDPNFAEAHLYLAMVYESLGRFSEGLAELEKCRNLSASEADTEIARIYVLQGRRADALAILKHLILRHKAGHVPASDIALVYAALGDKDHAFQWLQHSRAEHAADLLQINDDLRLDSLHSDPRFRDLLRSVNYPD